MDKKHNLVWIDLEMTGLNPASDCILEATVMITDGNLNLLHEGLSFVIHQSDDVLDNMIPWCKEHHGKSGLTQAARDSSTSVEMAQEQIFGLIKQFCEPHKGILAGNSVWQDRLFLERFMPEVVGYLHYRLLDVSSLKEIIVRWYSHDPNARFKKSDTHRALTDIHESIAELAHYRKYFFK
jgi:oligoribonuclease